VGEILHDYIESQLGEAPAQVAWDEALLRAWLPLDEWIRMGLRQAPSGYPLDSINWLAIHCHLRRLDVPDRQKLLTPGHFGRVCPFETPEGPNMGRRLSIAVGAEIREGKLVIVDERPEAALGLTAAMVPLLEHDDPFHLLMGTNMMRQWLPPSDPEPALVQSGNEPNVPDFWCGRNLLTAFICWGEDTFEEGVVLSETGARQLSYPYPVEPGDKLSNRHGIKGVVSRILPDEQMPHLADGTPVDLMFHSSGLHARMNFGQVREALLGRIARV
jgi:DNA-directed RNA polymerase beta subunit